MLLDILSMRGDSRQHFGVDLLDPFLSNDATVHNCETNSTLKFRGWI